MSKVLKCFLNCNFINMEKCHFCFILQNGKHDENLDLKLFKLTPPPQNGKHSVNTFESCSVLDEEYPTDCSNSFREALDVFDDGDVSLLTES